MYPQLRENGACFLRESRLGYEIELVNQWLAVKPGTVFYDRQGATITVLHPGRRNVHEGPDIDDAVIIYREQILRGPVECHLRSRNWFDHKHHANPVYNRVILHVVREISAPDIHPTLPTVTLPRKRERLSGGCDLSALHDRESVRDRIRILASQRWQHLNRRFLRRLDRKQPVQKILLVNAFRVLGAGGNQDNFEKLAENLDGIRLTSLSPDDRVRYLRVLSERLGFRWKKVGVRPANQPLRRFSLAARIAVFIERAEMETPVSPETFHGCFDLHFRKHSGAGIRVELLGNVFYPFMSAGALKIREYELYDRWRSLWYSLKLPYSYQKYVRRFGSVFLPADLRRFWILQGLIHLDRYYCIHRLCRVCPAKGGYVAGN